MLRHRFAAFILIFVLLLAPMQVFAAEGTGGSIAPPAAPEKTLCGIDATSAVLSPSALELDGQALLLYEMTTGTMVYAKNIDQIREPASVTKLMTCLLALENGSLTDQVTVTETALATMDPNGSSAGLLAGETYSLEQLLYCLMVQSANDAALVIAEYIGGSQEGFTALMNRRAAELGCMGTHFLNPHGLHEDGHCTTARDLAKILLADLRYDFFLTLYETTSYVLPATESREERTLFTTNYLISKTSTDAYFDARVTGGKTGFTTPAGRCLACTASQGSLQYLVIVLGATGADAQGNPVYGSFPTASALLDAGFQLCAPVEAVPSYQTFSVSIPNAAAPAALGTTESVVVTLPVAYDPEDLSTKVTLTEGLTAPLNYGDPAGNLSVYYDGVLAGTTALYAGEDIAYSEASQTVPIDKEAPGALQEDTKEPASGEKVVPHPAHNELGIPWNRLPMPW